MKIQIDLEKVFCYSNFTIEYNGVKYEVYATSDDVNAYPQIIQTLLMDAKFNNEQIQKNDIQKPQTEKKS